MDSNIKRGDIYYADLSPVVGSEQGGIRPVLIVQNNVGNRYSPTVIAAAITSQINKAKMPTHITVGAPNYGLTKDSIILTLACGKYRFNDLDLGTVAGLPRLLDMGQCNDAYGAVKVAVALAKAFDCSVNDLPLTLVLSWYEQKAVCILLSLLHLGIRNIYLGPTLPAFVSPGVLNYLVEQFDIHPVSTPEEDIRQILGQQ